MLDSLVVHLGRRPTSCSSSSSCATGVELDDELRARIAGALRDGALAAPRARHDRRRAGDPAHADRARSSSCRSSGSSAASRGRGGQPRRARGPGRDRRLRRLRGRPRMTPLRRLDHLLVLTDDLEGTKVFYEALGLRGGRAAAAARSRATGSTSRGRRACTSPRAAPTRSTRRRSACASSPPPSTTWPSPARTTTRWPDALEGAGLEATANTVPGAVRQLFLTDPNGVRVELNFPLA